MDYSFKTEIALKYSQKEGKIMFFRSYNSLFYFVQRHFTSLFPFLTVHKTYNVLLSLLEKHLRKKKCISMPFIYRIDPCSLCNLSCISCKSHSLKTNEKRIMNLDDFKKIINNIQRYALRVSLYDMGEPLLNKNIYTMIKYASDKHISTLISTNFNLFKKEHLEELFNSQLTVLEPCLDGFTQENYEKYRKGGNVEVVKNNIEMVVTHKIRKKTKLPIVDVQVVVFDHIKEEIPLVDNFLKKCKVDKITYRGEVLGFNSPETTRKNMQTQNRNACFWLYIGMMIRPDGNVYPCCGRGFDRFPYGNLLKNDISEIWNNKYYRFSRALFSKGPDLDYDEEMLAIPCIACGLFKKQRTMKKDKFGSVFPVK
ncbi:MAG: SPASM domain-containing protein [Flavobacteriales bacterium]|nr:SPASM domain-containing protein [Flavobacteriales bacterium]